MCTKGTPYSLLVVHPQLARGFGCRVKIAHQDKARSWLPGKGLGGCLHNARPWVLTPSPAAMILRLTEGGLTSLPTHHQQQFKMGAWHEIIHLMLVTMVQAAGGPGEDPPLGLRSPACTPSVDLVAICLLVE